MILFIRIHRYQAVVKPLFIEFGDPNLMILSSISDPNKLLIVEKSHRKYDLKGPPHFVGFSMIEILGEDRLGADLLHFKWGLG